MEYLRNQVFYHRAKGEHPERKKNIKITNKTTPEKKVISRYRVCFVFCVLCSVARTHARTGLLVARCRLLAIGSRELVARAVTTSLLVVLLSVSVLVSIVSQSLLHVKV